MRHQLSLVLTILLSTGSVLLPVGTAQTLSDCHHHGNVEYCLGPDGRETPLTTPSPSTTTPLSGPASVQVTTTAVDATPTTAEISEVTGCHKHATQTFCIAPNGAEFQVTGTVIADPPPAQFTGCHSHGADTFCFGPDGDEVLAGDDTHTEEPLNEDEHDKGGHTGGEHCHFHAGVEHCVGGGDEYGEEGGEAAAPARCTRRDREYNIPIRVGSLFVVLVTSSIAVFGPIFYTRIFSRSLNSHIFTAIKQFGAGVMIATAFVHLFTHAHLMFTNECLGELQYEATAGAIAMAGIVLTFLLEFVGNRTISYKCASTIQTSSASDVSTSPGVKDPEPSSVTIITNAPINPHQTTLADLGHHHHHVEDVLSVVVLEAGIIFHSVIIGVTLIVAGDSAYISLFIVIIFHQAFEGLALGSRIAELARTKFLHKLVMAVVFAAITPIGMAIGLGAIHTFNGNDKSTIIAMGTLDALSAGILTWAALVDMLAHDWIYGDMKNAPVLRTTVGIISVITGMVLMGLLGKWT